MKYIAGIIGAAVLIILTYSIYYTPFWKETFNSQKLPKEYHDYTSLHDTISTDYTITTLGDNEFTLFEDTTGNFLISAYDRSSEDDFLRILYKIDKEGSIVDSLLLSREISFDYYSTDADSYNSTAHEPIILGSIGYMTWLEDGDKTIKQFKEIDTEKELKEYLPKSEIVSFDKYEKAIYLRRQNVWYKATIPSEDEDDYNRIELYDREEKFRPATNLKTINSLSLYNCEYPNFHYYPERNDNLTLIFFEKRSYNTPSFLRSIIWGSSSHSWDGSAYYKLHFANADFCFHRFMRVDDDTNTDYSSRLKIMQNDNFALISHVKTYLVKMNNNK